MALKTRYSPLQQFSLENLSTAFAELTPLRKLGVLGAAAAVVALILFLPLSLVSGKVNSLKKEIASAQKGYIQVTEKISEYQRIRSQVEALETRFGKAAGSLTTRIESIAKKSDIAVDQVKEKAPQETDFLEINSLEVRLTNVSLPQLTEFLYNLENDSASPMRIRRIQIKPRSSNRQVLDVSFEAATFTAKKDI